MLETKIAEIDLESLKERLREELERMAAPPVDPSGAAASSPVSAHAPAPSHDESPSPAPPPPGASGAAHDSSRVSYSEIARESGTRFIRTAYERILGRPPDPTGLIVYGEALRSGKMTKAEVLFHLRRSVEGRAKAVRIKGLWAPLCAAALGKIPLVGRLFSSEERVHTRIADIEERLASPLEPLAAAAVQTRREWTGYITEVVHPRLEALETRLEAVDSRLMALEEKLRTFSDLVQKPIAALLSKDLPGHLAEHAQAIALLRQMLADHQRMVSRWLHETAFPAESPSPSEATVPRRHPRSAEGGPTSDDPRRAPNPQGSPRPMDPTLDVLYAALEDALRGSSDEIRDRLRFYLPYVRGVPLELAPVPVVDVGCGRGEWLELLREEGINAVGVDLNPIMVDRCREKGLRAELAEATRYLRALGPGTVGVVTAFQLIEHLDLDELVRFFDAAYESLIPGGLMVCETPNPENLMVSIYAFHLDPTHRRPLPPPLTRFLVQWRGFARADVVRPPRPGDEPPEAAQWPPLMRKLLFSEADYAVIARKAPCDLTV